MRAEDDIFTLELPGIAIAPVRRQTAADRQRLVDYRGPRERKRCDSCGASAPTTDDLSAALRCRLYDFPVHRGGVCRDWSPASRART